MLTNKFINVAILQVLKHFNNKSAQMAAYIGVANNNSQPYTQQQNANRSSIVIRILYFRIFISCKEQSHCSIWRHKSQRLFLMF